MKYRRSKPLPHLAVSCLLSGGFAACGGESHDPTRPEERPHPALDAGAEKPRAAAEPSAGVESDGGPADANVPENDGAGGAREGGSGDGAGAAASGGGGETPSGIGGAGSQGGAGGGPAALGGGSASGGSASGGATSGGGASSGGTGTGGTADDEELCEWGSYDTDPDADALACAEWTVCPPGTFMSEHGGFFQDRLCEPCPEGTFSVIDDALFCSDAHRCFFGEQVEVELSATSDRSCALAQSFTPREGMPGTLVVSDEVVRFLVRPFDSYLYYADITVENYSPEGDGLGSWVLGKQGSAQILDLAQVGDAVFVAGASSDAIPFIRKLAADGSTLWQQELEGLGDVIYQMGIAEHDGLLHVAANSYSYAAGETLLTRHVLDLDGNVQVNQTLAGRSYATGFDGSLWVVLSPTGTLFVAGSNHVQEFALDGELLADSVLGDSTWIQELGSDGSDGVYALTFESAGQRQVLYHVGPNEDLAVGVDLGYDYWTQLQAFTVTSEGLLFVGYGPDGPLLLRTDLDGRPLSSEVAERDYAQFTAIAVAPSGAVLVAGMANQRAFVAPWPN